MTDADATILPEGPGRARRAAGFTPGQLLAGRYRMVGPLGRGGMGEVYRADDLKLGTPVALKFLPRHVEADPDALERFHAEVRIARQVSHPHVCRVFDIAEVDGRHFLSMEYVGGEDLASLLHRIGRLPAPKALELSRQLCAGLAAAHDQGVLHRDLKPGNVMIDGHGRARITDFGLAVIGRQVGADYSGTPAYMAPEQLSGQPASTQSDLYALGLVMYEMFTGERPFSGSSVADWTHAHTSTPPVPPSTRLPELEGGVERVILRCLEKDPEARPRSASQVALALPGGDPLAAAVAAGETPSPEMVAAAGGEGALGPRQAWWRLCAALAGLAGLIAVAPYSADLGLAPMTRSPDVLRDRAEGIVRTFGYPDAHLDDTWWLDRDYDLLRWMADHLVSTDWRARLSNVGPPVLLTYRRSDEAIEVLHVSGSVTATTPAPAIPGSGDVRVVVDGAGRLREFLAAPPAVRGAAADGMAPEVVFTEAGFDPAALRETEPTVVPPVPYDRLREWTASHPAMPELPVRVALAWFEGRLHYASVHGPWMNQPTPFEASAAFGIRALVTALMLIAVLTLTATLARVNLRSGRGDRRGALRVAVVAGTLSALVQVVSAHVPSGAGGFGLLNLAFRPLSAGASTAVMAWVLYIALEPYARRHLPGLLVGWARLVEGRLRDPRVAADVLTGVAVGLLLALVAHAANGLPTVVPVEGQTTVSGFTYVARAPEGVSRLMPAGAILEALDGGLILGLVQGTLLLLLRLVMPRWAALALSSLLLTLLTLGAENPVVELPVSVMTGIVSAVVLHHLGLLSYIAMRQALLLATLGVTLGVNPTLWYGPASWLVAIGLVVLCVTAFRTALAGRAPWPIGAPSAGMSR
ncbi:MAG: serine/threonine-protein kinase [Vicinamibacterales bacterium]